MKKNKETKKQLSIEERRIIERCINTWRLDNLTFQILGDSLNFDPTTISKEIKKNRIEKNPRKFNNYNLCKHKFTCKKRDVCNTSCKFLCRNCEYCNSHCADYVELTCPMLNKPPYVCNCCEDLSKCRLRKYFYYAEDAQKQHDKTAHESRSFINMTYSEWSIYENTIKQGLKKGQSVEHIVNSNVDKVPYSVRSVYRHFETEDFTELRNIDLRRKVSIKLRPQKRTKAEERKVREAKIGHTYNDFLKYIEEHPYTNIMEMDTVIGKADESQCLLTFMQRRAHTSFAFILQEHNSTAVVEQLDEIYEHIGKDAFKKAFGIILTDNGTEFDNVHRIEFDSEGNRRCRVFYCDPNASRQKGMLESEHRQYRYVLPKSTSFANLTQNDVKKIYINVNNHIRKHLGKTAPIKLALAFLPEKLIEYLGLIEIPANEVCLTPKLLKKTKE